VKDTSGRGLDGRMVNGSYYDATEKALVFDGTDDYVKGSIPSSLAGNHAYSFSMWVKPDAIQAGYIAVFEMGLRTNDRACGLYLNGGVIVHLAFANNLTSTTSVVVNQWIHIVGTYTSGSRKVYADGVLIGSDTYSSLNIGATEMTLGANNEENQEFNGSISNFKLYDVAITADEVKRLYDMGRCDEGHHVVNFSKTRVGIGLGDGEVPRAALDVRGNVNMASMRLPSAIGFHAYNSTSSPITWSGGGANIEDEFNSTYFNYDGCYNTTTGRFTAPVKGIYGVQLQIRTKGSYYCVYVPHYNSSDTFQYHVINQAEHDITSNNGHRNMAGFVHMDKGSYLLVDSCGGSGEMFIDTGGWSKFVVVLIQETE
jgi:hypothetical protein